MAEEGEIRREAVTLAMLRDDVLETSNCGQKAGVSGAVV